MTLHVIRAEVVRYYRQDPQHSEKTVGERTGYTGPSGLLKRQE